MSLANNLKLRRTQMKLSQKGLAEKAGVSQQLIHALEAGTTRSSKFIDRISEALECGVADIDPGFGIATFSRVQEPAGRTIELPKELPVFAADTTFSAAQPDPEDAIDFIPRPFPLQNMRRAYAVMVLSQAMRPEFETGDYVLVNPHLPPLADTSCVFSGESAAGRRLMIGRLVAETAEAWQVRLWNPANSGSAEQRLPRDAWGVCHRIIGRYCRK